MKEKNEIRIVMPDVGTDVDAVRKALENFKIKDIERREKCITFLDSSKPTKEKSTLRVIIIDDGSIMTEEIQKALSGFEMIEIQRVTSNKNVEYSVKE